MGPEAWAALAVVFMLGAMSPGPSLAVILSNTISGGRRQGIATGLGHGIGFGIYAFLAKTWSGDRAVNARGSPVCPSLGRGCHPTLVGFQIH